MDWRHRAACLTEDPELFFPIGNSGPALAQVEQAKRVCNRCEVSDICLKWALDTGQDAGVWVVCPKRNAARSSGGRRAHAVRAWREPARGPQAGSGQDAGPAASSPPRRR